MIDWHRVHELQDEVVERLRQDPDPTTFEAEFHFLKGSALNLGFQAFADLCSQNERNAAEGKLGEIDVSDAIDCYHFSCQHFLKNRETQRAA